MRSMGLAYLLWFFVGIFGAHRFYCGRVFSGLLWLFTGGLAGIGWLVDAFLIPGMVRQANLEETVHDWQARMDRMTWTPPHALRAYPGYRVIYCPRCGSPMQIPAQGGGSDYACPGCRSLLTAPR